MTTYEVSATIAAPPAVVWRVLLEVERMPEWTESMTEVSILGGGRRIGPGTEVRIKQPRLSTAVWRVEEVEHEHSFRWAARNVGVTSTADHVLTSDTADGPVTVTLTLTHSGPLSGLVGALTGRTTRRYLSMELSGLKRVSEAARQDEQGSVDPPS